MAHGHVSHVRWTRIAPLKRAEQIGQGAALSPMAKGGLHLGKADLVTRFAVHKTKWHGNPIRSRLSTCTIRS